MITTFDDIIHPITREEFFKNYWGKRPLFVEGDKDRFRSVMGWDDLTEIIQRTESWTPNTFKLIKNGQPADPRLYCRKPHSQPELRPDWDKVQPLVKSGATIALLFVQSMTPQLRSITELLEEAVGGHAQMNVYCSWEREQGLSPHFDTHDVFALHLEGEKKWRVYEEPIDRPIAHPLFDPKTREKITDKKRGIALEPVMKPGSFLYIPRGWFHEAVGVTRECFHIASGMHYPVGIDALNIVWNYVSLNPAFRSVLARAAADGSEKSLKEQLGGLGVILKKAMTDERVVAEIAKNRDQFRGEKIKANLPGDITGD